MALDTYTTEELVRELIARGALRSYGVSKYVPGIVRTRYIAEIGERAERFSQQIRAELIHEITKSLATTPIMSFDETRAQDIPGNEHVAPNDMIYTASLLTLDPAADMEAKGCIDVDCVVLEAEPFDAGVVDHD